MKKILATLLSIALLGQNFLFAQAADQKKPLSAVQAEANQAIEKIGKKESFIRGLVPSSVSAVLMGGFGLYRIRKLEKINAQLAEKNAQLMQENEMLTSIKTTRELMESGWVKSVGRMERSPRSGYMEGIIKGAHNIPSEQELIGWGFSQKESRQIIKWINELDLFAEGSENPRNLQKVLQTLAMDGSKAAKEVSSALLRRSGLLGLTILIFVSAANAQTQDERMVYRIMQNPNLFLEANAQQLEDISHNEQADLFVRSYTEGVVTLAAMPQAQRQEILQELGRTKQQQQKQARQDIVHSLRGIQAR